jgi:hypothetical protein
MSLKFKREQRYYLFWIYPLIFLGLTVYEINRDMHHKESPGLRDAEIKMADSLRTFKSIDSTMIFYTSIK